MTGCIVHTLPSSGFYAVCSDLDLALLRSDPVTALGGFAQPLSFITSVMIDSVTTTSTVLEANTFTNFTGITSLNIHGGTMDGPSVSVIEDDAFAGLPALRQLTLTGLKLEQLSFGSFRNLEATIDLMALDLSNDESVAMAMRNDLEPFYTAVNTIVLRMAVVCDCHLLWFRTAIAGPSPCNVICTADGNPDFANTCIFDVFVSDLGNSCPDICTTPLNTCDENSACTSTSNDNFTCFCHDGFVLHSSSSICEDVNECAGNATLCSEVEMCLNTLGSFVCSPILCPSRELPFNRSCICEGNLVRNQSSGNCECPVAVVMEYSERNGTCHCSDPLAVFSDATTTCDCNSEISLYSEQRGQCVCLDTLGVANGTSRTCDCGPGSHHSGAADRCVCGDPLAVPNAATRTCTCNALISVQTLNRCECRDLLAAANATTRSCQCSALAENSSVEGRCVCSPLAAFDAVSEMCACNSSIANVSADGTACECADPLAFFDAQSGHCVCGQHFELVNRYCVCQGDRELVNGTTCECSGGRKENEGGECLCPPGRSYNHSSQFCDCVAHASEIADTGECTCQISNLRTMVNNTCVCVEHSSEVNGVCVCEDMRQWDDVQHQCVCSTLYESDPLTLECVISGNISYQDVLSTAFADGDVTLIEEVVGVLSAQLDQDVSASRLGDAVRSVRNITQWLSTATPDESLYDVTQEVVGLASQLLSNSSLSAWQGLSSEDFLNSVTAVFQSVEAVGVALANLASATNMSVVEIRTENVYVRAVAANADNHDQWGTFSSTELQGSTSTSSSISLPQSLIPPNSTGCAVISGAVKGLTEIFLTATRNANNSSNVTAAPPTKLSGQCPAEPVLAPEPLLNSVVITTSLSPSCSVNTSILSTPVNVSLYHKDGQLQNPVCVSDTIQGSHGEVWSGSGCTVLSTNATRTLCSCDHLTSFAVLLHPIPATTEFFVLGIATKVGLCVSVVCLLLTVIILFLVKVKSELPKVHRQLALSLLLTEVVFLVGVDREAVPSPDGLCVTFAAVLHYLLLVTFTWMLIEGVHMFVMLVLVYYSKKVYILYYFLAWGIPIGIVGISLLGNLCAYESRSFCWISGTNSEHTLWGAVLAPISLVLVVNFFVLISVTVVVVKAKRNQSATSNTPIVLSSLRTAFVLFPLLGLGWVLGFFMIGVENLVYVQIIEWIFVAAVVLQGIAIFIMNCFVNKEVRTALLKKLRSGKNSLPRKKNALRRTSTVSSGAGVSLKQTWRRLSSGSLRKTDDITQLSLKACDDNGYTIARPQMLSPVVSDILEEDEIVESAQDQHIVNTGNDLGYPPTHEDGLALQNEGNDSPSLNEGNESPSSPGSEVNLLP